MKRKLFLFSFILFFSLSFTVSASENLSTSDALNILRAQVGTVTLTAEQQMRYDLNGDGVVDAADALLVLRTVVGTGSGEIITIKGIRYSADSTELNLSGRGLTSADLEPLKTMTNLTFLNLNDNRITDISALSELANLEQLSLKGNLISDISPLKPLENLTVLTLWANQINDITPLSSLLKLVYLDLDQNKISDVSALNTLVKLEELHVEDNPVSAAQVRALKLSLPNCDVYY